MGSQGKSDLKLMLTVIAVTLGCNIIAFPLVEILAIPNWLKYVPGTIVSSYVIYRYTKKQPK